MSSRDGSAGRTMRASHPVRIAPAAEERLQELPEALRARFHRMVAGILELLEVAPLPRHGPSTFTSLRFGLGRYSVLYSIDRDSGEVVIEEILGE